MVGYIMRRTIHAGKKKSGGLSLNFFTDDELYEIHLATLEVLERTGLFVESDEALAILDGGGASVDRENKIVKIPPHIVEEAVQSAPSKIYLAGRNPQNDFVLESNRITFTNFGAGISIVDPYTGKIRDSVNEDLANCTKLVDHLESIDFFYRAFSSLDVPEEVEQLYNAKAIFPNTTKHIFIGGWNTWVLNHILEMAYAIVGGKDKLRERPIITFVTCPVSPLKLVGDTCDNIIGAARSGLAVNMVGMPMAGGTSSIKLAGTLVDHNAEILGGIVLSQLTCKGAKIIYGSSNTAMDMQYGTCPVGSPEAAKLNAAIARLARYYSLPSQVAGG
jgi:trimethylamine--corrinoid protein Co-methyltransferase